MDAIRIDVAGERQVSLRFEEFPDALYEDLRAEIDDLTRQLYGLVRAGTPSKSGKLQSQEHTYVHTDKERIKGVVYIEGEGTGSKSDFAKAGALEYGSTGKAYKVAQYKMRLDHMFETKLKAPMTVIVQGFDRSNHIAEHRFMRGPLEAMRPEILSRLNAVVEKATEQANG